MSPYALILSLLMQVGPNPSQGAIPDYSAEVQDRAPRTETQASDTATAAAPRGVKSWLEECFELVDSDPARAHSKAQIRRDTSKGEDYVLANHCLGMAATALGRWDEARSAFVAARDVAPAEDLSFRARVGAMAGNAAMPAGDLAGALALLDQAETDARASKSAELIALVAVDKARALVALDRGAEAEALLEEATALQPTGAEAPLLLATLYRRMQSYDKAKAAIDMALERDPANPASVLEAGVIAVLAGRDDDARAAWQGVLAMAPGSDFAATAQGYLDQLPTLTAPEGQ